MAIAARSAKTGDTLAVEEFTGTVANVNSVNGTVQVRDDRGGYSHFVAIGQLTKVLPYTDGTTYIDAYNDRYTWVAATQAWRNKAGNLRAFDYPVRPLFPFAVGDESFTD